jgi:hypothetical protein
MQPIARRQEPAAESLQGNVEVMADHRLEDRAR